MTVALAPAPLPVDATSQAAINALVTSQLHIGQLYFQATPTAQSLKTEHQVQSGQRDFLVTFLLSPSGERLCTTITLASSPTPLVGLYLDQAQKAMMTDVWPRFGPENVVIAESAVTFTMPKLPPNPQVPQIT